MLNMQVPLEFVQSRTALTWPEVEFGVRNGWLDPEDAVKIAMAEVDREPSPSADVLELASVLPRERGRVPELIERLGRSGGLVSRDKWLYLLLDWVYCNRSALTDAFQVVEEIYATFDYPDEISSFVRYMPAKDPAHAGEKPMLNAWRQYLDRQRSIFGHSSGAADGRFSGSIR